MKQLSLELSNCISFQKCLKCSHLRVSEMKYSRLPGLQHLVLICNAKFYKSLMELKGAFFFFLNPVNHPSRVSETGPDDKKKAEVLHSCYAPYLKAD